MSADEVTKIKAELAKLPLLPPNERPARGAELNARLAELKTRKGS